MKISQIVAVTSWCSVVLILWGLVAKIFESSFVTWFAFGFFFCGVCSFRIHYYAEIMRKTVYILVNT